jgi:mannosyl-3-phosphoglycerate phosphatase
MQLLIFTDIDGSLLDFDSYKPGPAVRALEACRRAGVPVILCTSKPSAEVRVLRTILDLDTPYIVENGAAIFFPAGTGVAVAAQQLAELKKWDVSTIEMEDGETFTRLLSGVARAGVVEALGEIAREVGMEVRGISEMTVAEITERTGLPSDQARAATMREFSEPFIVLKGPGDAGRIERTELLELIRQAAERRGLACALGGRFFHLQGRHSKGTAVERAVACYSRAISHPSGSDAVDRKSLLRTMALGDAYNDLEMLAAVDEPVLIRRPDGTHAEGIAFPGLVRTEGVGPQGWFEAVMGAFEGEYPSGD